MDAFNDLLIITFNKNEYGREINNIGYSYF